MVFPFEAQTFTFVRALRTFGFRLCSSFPIIVYLWSLEQSRGEWSVEKVDFTVVRDLN